MWILQEDTDGIDRYCLDVAEMPSNCFSAEFIHHLLFAETRISVQLCNLMLQILFCCGA